MPIVVRDFGPEEEVQVNVSGDERSVLIHPWSAGENARAESEVYIAVGTLGENGVPVYLMPDGSRAKLDRNGFPKSKRAAEDYTNVIVNREDFVEGILAVFPELQRRDYGC